MRTIKYAGRFNRDHKREDSGAVGAKLDATLNESLEFLLADKAPPAGDVDHTPAAEWDDHRLPYSARFDSDLQ